MRGFKFFAAAAAAVVVAALSFLPAPAMAADSSKILVVYFSGNGNTRAIADHICEILGAAKFEVVPEQPYDAKDLDLRNENSRASREMKEPADKKVPIKSTKIEGWDDYGIVFLGYPIWNGEAAKPINSFVADNDFNGKRVIPFCSHEGEGMGESAKKLEKLARGGSWAKGGAFRARPSKARVDEWLAELGMTRRP